MNNIEKVQQEYADELLQAFAVEVTPLPTVAVSFRHGVKQSMFFAQGEDAEALILIAHPAKHLTTEQAIILYLDSTGVLDSQ